MANVRPLQTEFRLRSLVSSQHINSCSRCQACVWLVLIDHLHGATPDPIVNWKGIPSPHSSTLGGFGASFSATSSLISADGADHIDHKAVCYRQTYSIRCLLHSNNKTPSTSEVFPLLSRICVYAIACRDAILIQRFCLSVCLSVHCRYYYCVETVVYISSYSSFHCLI